MGMLERTAMKLALRDATVISVECRGCMASDHRIQWIGKVEGFETTAHAGEAARVRILKRDNVDARDADLGVSLEALGNGGFQEIAPKVWAVYR
jgi:hypothetical protein